MKIIDSTQYCSNAREYLTAAENGEVIVIIRHGKAIAKLSPKNTEHIRQ